MNRALKALQPSLRLVHKRSYMTSHLQKSISFNEPEQRIRDLLLRFCNHYNASAPAEKQLELRITGGWVRDKLLGGESNDLDIAINVLSGQSFALELLSWAETSQVDLGEHSSNLHTIKANPEKSKHLETCTTKLFGLDVDFVNLRNEQYTEDSRVPVIECGTAEEDALRRDATLNALFYNVNSGHIEDFTKRGLEDLENGILRTPLAPLNTFLDDPLRILRLVRFACRFNFVIDDETLDAMKDERMRDALVYKISRERVGVELDKILVGPNVAYGLRLFNRIGLTDCIFSAGGLFQVIKEVNSQEVLDEIDSCRDMVNVRVHEATQLFERFSEEVQKYEALSLFSAHVFGSKSERKLFWLSTILRPYGNLEVQVNKKPKAISYVSTIIKEGLRFGKNDYENVPILVSSTPDGTLVRATRSEPSKLSRSHLGLYVRHYGTHFETCVLVDLFNDYIESSEVAAGDSPSTTSSSARALQAMESYESLLQYIKEQGLEKVIDMKPMIDGKIVSKVLQRKPGPWMKEAVEEVVRWQLDNPDKSVDECVEHIRAYCREN